MLPMIRTRIYQWSCEVLSIDNDSPEIAIIVRVHLANRSTLQHVSNHTVYLAIVIWLEGVGIWSKQNIVCYLNCAAEVGARLMEVVDKGCTKLAVVTRNRSGNCIDYL